MKFVCLLGIVAAVTAHAAPSLAQQQKEVRAQPLDAKITGRSKQRTRRVYQRNLAASLTTS